MSILDQDYEIALDCISVRQPVGTFYVASIESSVLRQITFADVRELRGNREIDEYLGIQREINPKRVKEIGKYVNTVDACFPTAVILAVPGRCAEYDEQSRTLVLRSDLSVGPEEGRIDRTQIARVLDGQHRIEGLEHLEAHNRPFYVNVSIFVDMDIESQAYLFSVVNLAQTKVSKSLVYDLFEYSRSRSPQKTSHNIAVALDRAPDSPFIEKIKRLGVATKGRYGETLTQATFVESLLPYISADPRGDRDIFLRGSKPVRPDADALRKQIFRSLFLEERDMEIADVVFNFFSAARSRWPSAWLAAGGGAVLGRTNGFKALMRLLRPAYLHLADPGDPVSEEEFLKLFSRSALKEEDFTTENFKPGTSGETLLFNTLRSELRI